MTPAETKYNADYRRAERAFAKWARHEHPDIWEQHLREARNPPPPNATIEERRAHRRNLADNPTPRPERRRPEPAPRPEPILAPDPAIAAAREQLERIRISREEIAAELEGPIPPPSTQHNRRAIPEY